MDKVNFSAIKEHAGTHYGDFTGVIQIDGHSNISSIYKLCEDHNFSTSDIFIIGFEMSDFEGIGQRNQTSCSILYVSKDEYGDNFEAIETNIRQNGKVTLKKKNLYVNYSDLGKYIKRYNFIATTELTRFASTIEIEEEDEY